MGCMRYGTHKFVYGKFRVFRGQSSQCENKTGKNSHACTYISYAKLVVGVVLGIETRIITRVKMCTRNVFTKVLKPEHCIIGRSTRKKEHQKD